jgi:hypothetical protein
MRLDEEVSGQVTAIVLQAFPELSPNTTSFPAAEAVIHGIPVATLPWHIVSGYTDAGHREDCFDESAVAQLGRTARFVFDGSEPGFNLRPNGIGEE